MSALPSGATLRPKRRDALSNRKRILDAAAAVFLAEGLSGSVEEVARLAGVGVGTLYRHFPTKERLVDELVEELLGEVQAVIDAAAGQPSGFGLEWCLWRICELQARHRGCQLRLWKREAHPEATERARAGIASLLREAQAAGRIREEATREDISLVLATVGALIEQTGTSVPNAWRRSVELLIAGLRPGGAPLGGRALFPKEAAALYAAAPPLRLAAQR